VFSTPVSGGTLVRLNVPREKIELRDNEDSGVGA